jgi:hypothetical protein
MADMHVHLDRRGLSWRQLSRDEDRQAKDAGKENATDFRHSFEAAFGSGAKAVGKVQHFVFSFSGRWSWLGPDRNNDTCRARMEEM